MLEVSTLRSPSKAEHVVGFPTSTAGDCDDFNLLDYIDLSCCDVPLFDADGDILPDLEVDPTDQFLAEFSSPEASPAAADGGCRSDDDGTDVKRQGQEEQQAADEEKGLRLEEDGEKAAAGDVVTAAKNGADEDSGGAAGSEAKSSASAGGHSHSKKKKPSAAAAGNHSNGKRKVDWTPELHRRFVQAVEQLGIDKAVPSRILEIMGIECLTRHNVASHLQKYRSHRKHLMAREAEAATWAQKRQMYAPAARKDAAAAGPWVVPTIGFPSPAPLCRPLHVWGHPPTTAAVEAPTMLPVWPWADPASAYWHQHYNAAMRWGPHQQAAAAVTPPMPMYRPPTTTMVPPPPRPTTATTTSSKLADLQLQLDAHPSKESIDAAIGDVLVKPWLPLPLPLGLKPPSLDSVMSELRKQGIPKVPPAAAAAAAEASTPSTSAAS